MSDDALIQAWRVHRDEMRTASIRSPRSYLPYDQYQPSPEMAGRPWTFAFSSLANDFLRELRNTLNRWQHSLASLEGWTRVLNQRSEADQFELLFEFVEPLAESLLTTPYRAKQALIFTLYRLLEFLDPTKPSRPEREIGFNALKAMAAAYPFVDTVFDALRDLDGAAFRAATDNFRNRFQHRIAPAIGVGQRATVTRIAEPDRTGFGFGYSPPLALDQIRAELEAEHARTVKAFQSLWDALPEIEQRLPRTCR